MVQNEKEKTKRKNTTMISQNSVYLQYCNVRTLQCCTRGWFLIREKHSLQLGIIYLARNRKGKKKNINDLEEQKQNEIKKYQELEHKDLSRRTMTICMNLHDLE